MITIITTIYNANFLDFKKTFDSVLLQSCTDYEYIVQSAGKSVECENYVTISDDSRARLIKKSDKGIYHGMNLALESSNSNYVIFLNSGDVFIDKNFLKKAIDIFDSSRDIKIVACNKILYGESLDKSKIRMQRKSKFLVRGLCHQSFIANIQDIRFDLDYSLAADFKSVIDITKGDFTKIAFINICGVFYQAGGVSDENAKKVYLEMTKAILVSQINIFSKFFSSVVYFSKFLLSFRF
ncbi:glycosyltransferase [Vibrio sp. VB16]|uniref:glycosyltransferase n=1 Tax=Vibrio sp. VB16 TaxID=2785746 RepID=UPI00189D49DD|nr:glycosyltransferase [Vibrio sp. VB16]UGA57355.1 glycosyltransferase [Vibrio sp. VB16]